MNRALPLACIIVALTIPSLASGQQKDSFWKMPKLNPFKKADRSRRSAPWAGANKQKQSMGQRLTKRPKKLLTQTKDMMTPWKSEAKRNPRIRPSRDNRLARRSKHDRWKPFSRWRGDSKKRDFLTTPQDFIAKRQLGF